MNNYFKYKISSKSFIVVYEDIDNWLHVVDDPFNVCFFSVSDIENALGHKLTLIGSMINTKVTLN